MWKEEIKKFCRNIDTGLTGKKNYEILCSVEGQLSDGMWENSFVMRGYWMFECIKLVDDKVIINISKSYCDYDFGKARCNKFVGMSDNQVKGWFANKIKQIIKQEEKDKWEDHHIEWKRDCEVVSKYIGYDEDITVSDCYKAYDILKGRRSL